MTEKLLAGYTLGKKINVALRDAATGCYFLRSTECDGAHRRLVLATSKDALPSDVFELAPRDRTFAPGKLPHTSTGRGVSLGDSLAQVARRMGRPSWQGRSKFRRDEMVWSYHWSEVGASWSCEGKALFRFRRDRVTCIELLLDYPD